MAAARPQVSVQSITKGEKSGKQVAMPSVFLAPIRPDVVHYVHVRLAKNHRQPYAVNEDAGMQHSAHSWGTGRAVARIPRVSGSGTSRAGQAAFGNMCRKGRMFAPTKTWRKWHYRVNLNQKRYAVASALAASAVPALVMARGHHVHRLPEVPLVLDDKVESLSKTKEAIAALRLVGAYSDVEKAKRSLKLRAGKGKGRARRYTQRKGPLVVYAKDNGVTRAFRNLPGVELCHVDSLNLLQLAPGSHLGRFIIWSQSAFKRLDLLWGKNGGGATLKKGYHLPHNIMTNSDISRVINSDEVQSKVRPAITKVPRYKLKKNPLKNLGVMYKLNPYALHTRRAELHHQRRVALIKRNRAVQLAKTGKRVASTKDRRIRKAKKAHREQKRKTFARISAE